MQKHEHLWTDRTEQRGRSPVGHGLPTQRFRSRQAHPAAFGRVMSHGSTRHAASSRGKPRAMRCRLADERRAVHTTIAGKFARGRAGSVGLRAGSDQTVTAGRCLACFLSAVSSYLPSNLTLRMFRRCHHVPRPPQLPATHRQAPDLSPDVNVFLSQFL